MALTRRTALALSGAVAGTVAVASLAGALVIGGRDDADPTPPDTVALVGHAAPDASATPTTEPRVEVVYQDVYDLPPATAPDVRTGAAAPSPAPAAPVLTSSDDDRWDDDGWDDDGSEDDEWDDDDRYEDEDHEEEDDWEG